MSGTLIDTRPSGIKKSGSAVTSRAGIDTIELLTSSPQEPVDTDDFRGRLLNEFGIVSDVRKVMRTDPKTGEKRPWRKRLFFNRVPVEALAEIDQWQQKHDLVLCRADVGIAIKGLDTDGWLDLVRFLIKQKHARWNRYEGLYEETHYTADMKSDRFMCAYVARGEHDKAYLTGNTDPVAWIEVRMGDRMLRRWKIDRVSDLATVNPKAVFDDTIKWAWSDWNKERRKLQRKIKPQCRDEPSTRDTHPIVRRYREAGYKRHRILNLYHRNFILPRSPIGLSRETFIGWMPETPFIENINLFGMGEEHVPVITG